MELYYIREPETAPVPVLANILHSGTYVPDEVGEQFSDQQLKSHIMTDWHLDKLYDFLHELGVTSLVANIYRFVVDLNREIKEPLYGPFFTSVICSEKPPGLPEDRYFPIYKKEPTRAEIEKRIQKYHTPYHEKLNNLVDEMVAKHGKLFLLSLHRYIGGTDSDICVGDADGTSCSTEFTDMVVNSFEQAGLRVARNNPYKGGYVTRHYSQKKGVEALLIESRSGVYIDPQHLDQDYMPPWDTALFYQKKLIFQKVFEDIIDGHVLI